MVRFSGGNPPVSKGHSKISARRQSHSLVGQMHKLKAVLKSKKFVTRRLEIMTTTSEWKKTEQLVGRNCSIR